MKEKPNPLIVKINELKQVVDTAGNFPPKRLRIIYNNAEHRLQGITGLDTKYITEMHKITESCIKILDDSGAEDSYNAFSLKLGKLLNNIIDEAEQPVVAGS